MCRLFLHYFSFFLSHLYYRGPTTIFFLYILSEPHVKLTMGVMGEIGQSLF